MGKIATEGLLVKQVNSFYRLFFKYNFFGLFKVSTYFCAILTLGSQENICNPTISCKSSIAFMSGKEDFRYSVTLR